jgi:hypothetical protein
MAPQNHRAATATVQRPHLDAVAAQIADLATLSPYNCLI